MRGHYTICTKSYAKPKNIWNQKGFTNDRLRMNLKADGFWPDFVFKILFQNSVERQPRCEIGGVRLPFSTGRPYRTISYKSCGDPKFRPFWGESRLVEPVTPTGSESVGWC
jgi:hypothetical protein